jgi:hypothetical protein
MTISRRISWDDLRIICEVAREGSIHGAATGIRQRVGIKKSTQAFGSAAYDLGYIDLEQRTLQPLDNPFGPRLSPMP